MGVHQLPSGGFRLQLRRTGLRIDEVHGSRTEADAALQRYLAVAAPRAGNERTLDQGWALYRASLDFTAKKPKTQAGEETHIKRVMCVWGKRAARSITPDDVEQYVAERLRAQPRPKADTVRNELAAVSAVFNYLRRKSLVAANPCIGVRRPAPERTMRRMTADDQGALMKLLNHANSRFRFAARLCLLVRETGARPGEWQAVEWSDIDLEQNKVTFRNTKYKSMPRTIPLTQAAITLVAEQAEDVLIRCFDQLGASAYAFPAISRDDCFVSLYYTGAVRDLKKLGLVPKGFRAHTGRHEYITDLVETSPELDDSRIMSLVGHHSHASMEIYKHARNVQFRPQLEALEPGRRDQRAKSFALGVGLPASLVNSYLKTKRAEDAASGLHDAGDERLYRGDTVAELSDAARRLGSTPAERLARLLALRTRRDRAPAG
jgi:integrase